MKKIRQGLFLASWFGVAGLSVLIPELAWGEGETPVLVAQAEELAESNSDLTQIEGRLDSSSDKSDNDTYHNVHTFEGQAGEYIVVELVSREFDAYLLLFDSEGNKIAEDDDGGGENNARVVVTLPSSGTYKIFVSTYEPAQIGSYTLGLRAALPEDLQLVEAKRLNQQALELYQEGKYSEAITPAEQVLAIHQRILGNEHPDLAVSLNNLAELYYLQGKHGEAEPYLLQSLKMLKRLLGEEHPDVVTSLNNLAELYYLQGKYGEAEPYLLQSLAMLKRLLGEEHPDVATSLNNLALLYTSQGRYEEGETYHLQSLEMRKRILGEEHLDVAASLNNLALLYKTQGRYEEAEPYYLKSLEMRKRILGEEHPHVAASLNNLAVLYYSQGKYREAETYHLQSLEMSKRILGEEHPHVALTLNNLAFLYESQGRHGEAEPYYLQSLEMSKRILGEEHPHVALTLNNLAFLYWVQDKTSLAIEFITQGLKIQESNLAYNLFAGFERQKRDYVQTISGTTDVAFSLHLNSAPNNPQAAELALNTVLQRKGRVLNFFANSLHILRQRSEPEDLQLLDELTTAYSQLANLIYNRPEKLPSEQYQAQVALLEKEVKKIEGELSSRSQEFRKDFPTPNIKSIQQLLPADAVLLEFVKYRSYDPQTSKYSKSHYAAYILTAKGEPQGIDLGEAETIEQAVKLFRFSVADPNTSREQVKQYARQLEQLVMEPVRKLLGNSKHILLAPQADLNLIPFEALVDEQERFLVEKYAFTYLTSGRDLLRLTDTSPSQQPPVVVVNPNFEVPGEISSLSPRTNTRSIDLSQNPFHTLSGTEEEGEVIARKLGVTPLTNSQATEAAIKQVDSPKVLHIATHGFFEESYQSDLKQQTYQDNPLLLSGLVLAGFRREQSGRSEDGILTALEVSALDLVGTKLVVLSACDTGLGNLDAGEGLYSLRRALVIAGAESQLISLWKVEDNATKELMIAYYDKLLANQGRSEALRQTQLEMLKSEEYAHPYYWAAFIPSGDWRPMD